MCRAKKAPSILYAELPSSYRAPTVAGKLGSAEKGRPITREQMEISRLRFENARPRMEMEIIRKAACFARESL